MGDGSPPEATERWRVLLVRVRPGSLQDVETVVPGLRRIQPGRLPQVVRVTDRLQSAQDTAQRMREAGAVVLVLGEPAGDESSFCEVHNGRIAARRCQSCGAPICTSCRKAALGDEVCADCWLDGKGHHRRRRLRQLFSLFLFSVFLYQVADWLRADREAIASGSVRVAVFQFVAPELAGSPLVRRLNAMPGSVESGTTLREIEGWYDREYERYTGRKNALEVDVLGPWGRRVEPPELDAESWWQGAWNAWSYARYFHQLARDQGVDPDSYTLRMYVVYTRGRSDLAAHSLGSEQGHVAIAYVDLDEPNPGYAILTVAHELGHTLGAEDLYDPRTFLSRYPEGYVEPYADPLYPQDWAEIMAVDRPVSTREEQELRTLDDARIGYHTAAAIGWIPREQARVFYQPPETTPLDRLEDRQAETPAPPPPPSPVPVAAPAETSGDP